MPTTKKTAAPQSERVEIKNRWSGEIIFTAEIACSPDTLPSIKLGLAVKAALKAGAYLANAYLADAYLYLARNASAIPAQEIAA
jgi:hypothetical protein